MKEILLRAQDFDLLPGVGRLFENGQLLGHGDVGGKLRDRFHAGGSNRSITRLFLSLQHVDMRLFVLAFVFQLIALVYGLKEPPKDLQIGKLTI